MASEHDVTRGLAERGLPDFAPYLMNRVMARYNARLRAALDGAGVSVPQMRALAVLSARGAQSIGDLATLAVTEPSTLSRNLDRMEADGWIERRATQADHRIRLVHLTPRGGEVWAGLWPHLVAAEAAMFDGIPAEERAAFTATLARILANVRRNPI
jgi:DNA-binding MarR family transcriptional regulator